MRFAVGAAATLYVAAGVPMYLIPWLYRDSGNDSGTTRVKPASVSERNEYKQGKGELERDAVLYYRRKLVAGSPADVSHALAVLSELSVYIEHQAVLRECGVFKAAAEHVVDVWVSRHKEGAHAERPLSRADLGNAVRLVADLSHNGNVGGQDAGVSRRLAPALVGMASVDANYSAGVRLDAVRALAGMAGAADMHECLGEAGLAGVAVNLLREVTSKANSVEEGELVGGKVEEMCRNVSGLMFALTAPGGDSGIDMLWEAGAMPVLLDAVESALRNEVREERRRKGVYAESMFLRQSLGAVNRMMRTKGTEVAGSVFMVRRVARLIVRAARESHDPHVRCFAAGTISRLAATGRCARALVGSGSVEAAVDMLAAFHVNTVRDPQGGTVGGPRGMSLGVCRCASNTVAALAGQQQLRAALRHADAVKALDDILEATPDPQYAQLEGDIRDRGRVAVQQLSLARAT